MYLRTLFAAICLTASLHAAGQLVSGPMLGYRAHRETQIWLETKDATEVSLTYHLAGQPGTARTLTHRAPAATLAGVQPQKFTLPLLEMGQAYEYSLTIDGQPVALPHPATFRTTQQWEWRTPPPDTTFLFGSCAYLNDPPYDRPGKPYGNGTEIFRHMAATRADFMIWGGDNLYLREADFSSASGIAYRYSHDRATPDLQPLLAAMHHYAIVDDHDLSSNNGNQFFELKATAAETYRAYWPNQTFGEPGHDGLYGKYFWADALFLLLDNRTFRDDSILSHERHPAKTQWGPRQLDWLKQSLLQAKVLRQYTFKFIVTGSQFLPEVEASDESHANFPQERADLLRFIDENKITGVIFLTGDVHHTGLYRHKLPGGALVHELTSSPLASGSWDVAKSKKTTDPMVIPGTLVGTQNYCQVTLSGPPKNRTVTIVCRDKTNQELWTRQLTADDLR